MRFRELENRVKALPAFNLNDVRKLDPDFHRQQLSFWLQRGYIKSLAGGYYILADQEIDERFLLTLANKIYEPSYVSLESALAYYQVIPESVLGVTSISSRKTTQFDSSWGIFSYRCMKPIYMFGYEIIESRQKLKYKIANLEKTILDFLYLNSGINDLEDFEALRWNKYQLLQLVDNTVFLKYLQIFDNKALKSRVAILLEYINA